MSPALVLLAVGACVPSGTGTSPRRTAPSDTSDTGAASSDAQVQRDTGVASAHDSGGAPRDTGAVPVDSGFAIDMGFDEPDAGFPVDTGPMLPPDGGVPSLCPPSGPFGNIVGDITVDLELPDCDGNMHRLHNLCGRKASWMFGMAGW